MTLSSHFFRIWPCFLHLTDTGAHKSRGQACSISSRHDCHKLSLTTKIQQRQDKENIITHHNTLTWRFMDFVSAAKLFDSSTGRNATGHLSAAVGKRADAPVKQRLFNNKTSCGTGKTNAKGFVRPGIPRSGNFTNLKVWRNMCMGRSWTLLWVQTTCALDLNMFSTLDSSGRSWRRHCDHVKLSLSLPAPVAWQALFHLFVIVVKEGII